MRTVFLFPWVVLAALWNGRNYGRLGQAMEYPSPTGIGYDNLWTWGIVKALFAAITLYLIGFGIAKRDELGFSARTGLIIVAFIALLFFLPTPPYLTGRYLFPYTWYDATVFSIRLLAGLGVATSFYFDGDEPWVPLSKRDPLGIR